MKIKELKHNHSLTDLLKVLLFSIMMLAPILAISVKCAYVVINKNAKDSYSDKLVDQTINITDSNKSTLYVQNQIVTFVETNKTYGVASARYGFSTISLDLNNLLNTTNVNYIAFRFYTSQAGFMFFYDSNDTEYRLDNYKNLFTQFTYKVDLTTYNSLPNISTYGNWYTLTYTTMSLDNVFYYAIDEVAQEPLFNWTQNTAIYTGVNAMCTGMEITSPIIPILITYWFLLTCIYVIIDILIKGFTMLTHLIGSKLA